MSLKECNECGHHVSSKAKFCPNCGAPPGSRFFEGSLRPILALILTGIIVMVVLAFAQVLSTVSSPDTYSEPRVPRAKKANTIVKTPVAVPPEIKREPPPTGVPTPSSAFLDGEKDGIRAAESGWGIPHPRFFLAIAQNRAPDQSKIDQWMEDYQVGFLKGYGSKKQIPDTSGLRPLEWSNLAVGTKLYNSMAQHQVTITSVRRGQGLIYVRYLNGTEEPKDFNALRSFWFTKH